MSTPPDLIPGPDRTWRQIAADGQAGIVRRDTVFGFLDRTQEAHRVAHPQLISNDGEHTMLRALRHELRRAHRMEISVAFVATNALAALKQDLLDFVHRGGTIRIVTSTYLGFNSPDAFRELLQLPGAEVRVMIDDRGFHAKGYVFEQEHGTAAIIGSSNLTTSALVENREWNLRFSALPDGDITQRIRRAIREQLEASLPLTGEWIAAYERDWVRPAAPVRRALGSPEPLERLQEEARQTASSGIAPNRMQREALDGIADLRDRGEDKALVISATGTGKTVLGALDVRQAAPERFLFVVHRRQILDKALQTFREVLGEPEEAMGVLAGPRRETDRPYVFAMIDTLRDPGVLAALRPEQFDYVLIDEVHRADAAGYRRVLDHLRPQFLLGLTATPDRTDGGDVYALFDHNVAYEIRLREALEAHMLVPFHYFGVTDAVDDDGELVGDRTDLPGLLAPRRVEHVVQAIRTYGHTGQVRGLIFCSRVEEARALAEALRGYEVNGARLRAESLVGADPQDRRDAVVRQLEDGELDYIVSVDLFNEGVDIPALNQVVMLRATQSAIVFTQQLGRGLRLAEGKDHLRVIDVIGNYQNSFLIPVALGSDSSRQKERLRKIVMDPEAPGLSSISFDPISRDRVLQAVERARLHDLAHLRGEIGSLTARIGRAPMLIDFARHDTVDPVLMASKRHSYWALLAKLSLIAQGPDPQQQGILRMLSEDLLPGRRAHEIVLLRLLMDRWQEGRGASTDELAAALRRQDLEDSAEVLESALRVLDFSFYASQDLKLFGRVPLIVRTPDGARLSEGFAGMLRETGPFAEHVDDALEAAAYLARHRGTWGDALRPGGIYTRRDVARLLRWSSHPYGAINGYKLDPSTRTCPIFITYHKEAGVPEHLRYEDRLLDPRTMQWESRANRRLDSRELAPILDGTARLDVFVRKSDDDGTEYTCLGPARAVEPVQRERFNTVKDRVEPVVQLKLELNHAVPDALYAYLELPEEPGENVTTP